MATTTVELNQNPRITQENITQMLQAVEDYANKLNGKVASTRTKKPTDERIISSIRNKNRSPVDRLYDVIENGIRPPHQQLWPGELAAMVTDYLNHSKSPSHPEQNPTVELTDDSIAELIKAAEAYANDPRNHQPRSEKGTSTHRQIQPSPFATAFIQSKLHPSYASFATRYVTANAKVRRRTKELSLDQNTLARRQYTSAEVAEMLKMFIQLDRLAYLDRVIAAERTRENHKFHNNLRDADRLRQNMIQISEEMAHDQARYNQLMKRFRSRIRGEGAERTLGSVSSHHNDRNIDYRKIEKYLGLEYERAVAEVNEKDLWHHPHSSNKMHKFLTPNGIRLIFRKLGMNVEGSFPRRVGELAQRTLQRATEQTLLSGFGFNVRELRTGEVQPFVKERPSRDFGRKAREMMERVM